MNRMRKYGNIVIFKGGIENDIPESRDGVLFHPNQFFGICYNSRRGTI